ncbi:MAG: hypothetical protein K2H14_06945 [Muribaculaceae bacterium]|nr:hypothetical protein [Muribaculaceae bacterium]
MKFFENYEQKEIQGLASVEQEIRSHERRERLHKVLIAGLGMMVVASFFAGHCANSTVRRFRRMRRNR